MNLTTQEQNRKNNPKFSRRNVLRPLINRKITIYARTAEIRIPKLRSGMICPVGKRLLIKDVCIKHSNYVLDHLWISLRPEIEHLESNLGSWIQLTGKVIAYKKDNEHHSWSYSLGGPFKVTIL